MNCYQTLTPDPDIWTQLCSELAGCQLAATEYVGHSNYTINSNVKYLVAAQLALWNISADIYGISGWLSTGPGWSMDWHRDGTDSISHVLCMYDTTAIDKNTGGRLAIKNDADEHWFDLSDGTCILMDQTVDTYLHKVEPIYTPVLRKCISVSLKLHTS